MFVKHLIYINNAPEVLCIYAIPANSIETPDTE